MLINLTAHLHVTVIPTPSACVTLPTIVQAKQAAKQAKKDVKTLEQQLKDKTKEIEKMTAKLRKMGAHGTAFTGGEWTCTCGHRGRGDMSPGCVPPCMRILSVEGALPIGHHVLETSRKVACLIPLFSNTLGWRVRLRVLACFLPACSLNFLCRHRTLEEMDGMTEREAAFISKRRTAKDRENTGAKRDPR